MNKILYYTLAIILMSIGLYLVFGFQNYPALSFGIIFLFISGYAVGLGDKSKSLQKTNYEKDGEK